MSPSRLTHLFKQEVGIPISRFIVWWRVRAAIEQLSKSATLTEAAHASGFSDLPHMSKTFKQLFGFAPSRYSNRTPLKFTVISRLIQAELSLTRE